jgi:hypothetical protein
MSLRARQRRTTSLHASSGIRRVSSLRQIVNILVYRSFKIPYAISFTAIVYPGMR